MINELTYDGFLFSDFDTYIASSNYIDGASKDVSVVQVPGRNGDLILDNKRFNNFPLVENLYIKKDILENIEELRDFLVTHSTKYYQLEESLYPDCFRMARFSGPFTMGVFDGLGGAISAEFDCKPQRWLKSGSIEQTITSGDELINPTRFNSQPLIRIYGNGVVAIGSQTITVTGNTYEYIDVDCELMNCFHGTTKLTSLVSLSGQEYPVLYPENNIITFEDVTGVKITPRWYTT